MDGWPKRPGRGSVRRGAVGTELVVYTIRGNPKCERLERFLVAAGIPYLRRDVIAQAGAMEEIAERTRGRIRLPAVRIGELLLESQTPDSLSRFLRRKNAKSP